MDEYQRHVRVWQFFRPLILPLMKRKFNYTYDPIPVSAAPYFLLCNHNMDLDPLLLASAGKSHTYFVATENVLRKGFASRLLMRYLKPIIHTKGKAGLQSSMEILRQLKAGHNVALFPEGNRSFNGVTGPIFPATGKLAKRSGASLVTYRMQGGYFTQPRWGKSLRRGKVQGQLVHVYSPEELKTMSDEEIIAAISRDLHEDAYETQASGPVAFRGSNLAEGLEAALFLCPKCRKIGTLHSHGDQIDCECGFSAAYDVYGGLADSDGVTHTVTDWDARQRQHLASLQENAEADTALFSDTVTVCEIQDHAARKTFSAKLTAYRDRFALGEKIIRPDEVEGVAIFSRNTLTAHAGAQYEIRGAENFCALKYLYLFGWMKKES